VPSFSRCALVLTVCNPGFSCSCSAANPTEAAHSRCTSAISPACQQADCCVGAACIGKDNVREASISCTASQLVPEFLQPLQWRSIGPYRGGRTRAVSGVPSQPGVFYIGVCNGGVWKTNDYGQTWQTIFDDQPTGSIGAIAVSARPTRTLFMSVVVRGAAPARPLCRRLVVYKSTRCRQNVDASRHARCPADSADRRRSARSQ